MSVAGKTASISPEVYLEGEKLSQVKHEYVAGHLYAMAGASAAHNRIAGNFYTMLRARLSGGPCAVFMSDLKLHVKATQTYYYPDVVVSCDQDDIEPGSYVISNPTLNVEVLSPSTERIDREEKLRNYQRLESLKEFVLVTQNAIEVSVYRRDPIAWQLRTFTAREILELASVDVRIPVEQVYEGVSY